MLKGAFCRSIPVDAIKFYPLNSVRGLVMLWAPQQNRAVCYSHWPSRHQAADPTCRLQNKQLERRNKLKTKTSKEKIKPKFAVVAVLGRPEAVRQHHVVFSSLLFGREETSLIPISRFLPWFCVSNMIRSRRVPSVRVPFFPFPPCSTGVMRCEDTPRMSSEPSAPLNPSDRDTGGGAACGVVFLQKAFSFRSKREELWPANSITAQHQPGFYFIDMSAEAAGWW